MQLLCFHYISTKIRNFKHLATYCLYSPVCVRPGQKTPKTAFVVMQLICHFIALLNLYIQSSHFADGQRVCYFCPINTTSSVSGLFRATGNGELIFNTANQCV